MSDQELQEAVADLNATIDLFDRNTEVLIRNEAVAAAAYKQAQRTLDHGYAEAASLRQRHFELRAQDQEWSYRQSGASASGMILSGAKADELNAAAHHHFQAERALAPLDTKLNDARNVLEAARAELCIEVFGHWSVIPSVHRPAPELGYCHCRRTTDRAILESRRDAAVRARELALAPRPDPGFGKNAVARLRERLSGAA